MKLLIACSLCLALAGCTRQTELTTPTTQVSKPLTVDASDLTLALESMRKLAEGNDEQPAKRTLYYLNQWISSDPANAAPWQPDPLIRNLPRAHRDEPNSNPQKPEDQQWIRELGKLQFISEYLADIQYLQQNLWLRDIAQRVTKTPPAPRLQTWLKEMEKTIGLPEAEQLAAAERLLDWTARNIQLDPLPPIPKDPLATAGSTGTILPAAKGDLGPGYAKVPLEILIYGHGDAHERARIFILLCRQVGIDAVMLGFNEEQSVAKRGWLPAVLVGGKLYLFDTGLGLPVPGAEGQGIATLDQVLKEPRLLKQLEIKGLPAYPVTEKDLKQGVLALIDAEPPALSRRMQLLQSAMPAATRLALGVQPSQLDAALRKTKVLSGVSLWQVPLDALLYRFGRQYAIANDPQLATQERQRQVVFDPGRPLIQARNLHLQAQYENDERKAGARSLYLQCRQPDREIDALMTNEFFRKSIGLERALPQDPTARKAQLDFITGIARQSKYDATYWLALTYYEVGKYDATIEWLGKPVVEVSPPSPWTPGARYNLARCYEQLGQPDLARKWLESDKDSPQRHGNLLRAKWLAGGESSQ